MKLQVQQINHQNLFKTEVKKIEYLTHDCIKVKNYVNILDEKINLALESQNQTMGRERKQLKSQLELVKERVAKQSIKAKTMEQYFVVYCENLLRKDIRKWQSNEKFYKQLFKHYDQQIRQKQEYNKNKKAQIKQLKQKIRNRMKQRIAVHSSYKNLNTETTWQTAGRDSKNSRQKTTSNKNLNSSFKNIIKNIIRSNTQIKLPQLQNKDDLTKKYMNSIGLVRTKYSTKGDLSLVKMLKLYLKLKLNASGQIHWFDKIILNKRNFQKLINYLNHDKTYYPIKKIRYKTEIQK